MALLVHSLTFTSFVLHSPILPITAGIFAAYCARRLAVGGSVGYQERPEED